MVEPTVGICDGNGRQRLGDGVLKGLSRPCLGGEQGRFELRPAWLDRDKSGEYGSKYTT
jgi:hypothetical protein